MAAANSAMEWIVVPSLIATLVSRLTSRQSTASANALCADQWLAVTLHVCVGFHDEIAHGRNRKCVGKNSNPGGTGGGMSPSPKAVLRKPLPETYDKYNPKSETAP